jgi:hypothetical protein
LNSILLLFSYSLPRFLYTLLFGICLLLHGRVSLKTYCMRLEIWGRKEQVLPLLWRNGKWLNSHSFLLDTDLQAWAFLRRGCSLLGINLTKKSEENQLWKGIRWFPEF